MLMLAEIRMIHWMCGYTGLDRRRNEMIRETIGVAPIKDKLRDSRLRRFGHVKMRSVDAPVMWLESINLPGCRRGRGWPKRS